MKNRPPTLAFPSGLFDFSWGGLPLMAQDMRQTIRWPGFRAGMLCANHMACQLGHTLGRIENAREKIYHFDEKNIENPGVLILGLPL